MNQWKNINSSFYKFINLWIYNFIGTHRSEMEVYGTNEVKQFCKVS